MFVLDGFVLECVAALKECSRANRLTKLTEEEVEEFEEEEVEDKVFILELERGEGGFGLSLVDTRVSVQEDF